MEGEDDTRRHDASYKRILWKDHNVIELQPDILEPQERFLRTKLHVKTRLPDYQMDSEETGIRRSYCQHYADKEKGKEVSA